MISNVIEALCVLKQEGRRKVERKTEEILRKIEEIFQEIKSDAHQSRK